MKSAGLRSRERLRESRSPSWGAWIEIFPSARDAEQVAVAPPRGERGLKSSVNGFHLVELLVAPPRGERGLKYSLNEASAAVARRSPSWGAWIEIKKEKQNRAADRVAPPRGERGLKSALVLVELVREAVAPPRGERGLKCHPLHQREDHGQRRSPSWGAWIEMR